MENQDNILDFTPSQQHPQTFAATTGIRFANFIIDRILGTMIFYAAMFGGIYLLGMDGDGAASAIVMLFSLAMIPGYYIIFEYFWGKTPGKFLTKTRVVNAAGKQPGFWNIVGRSLCRFIPFEPFSFLSGARPLGWHDSISKTYVVEDSFVNATNDFV